MEINRRMTEEETNAVLVLVFGKNCTFDINEKYIVIIKHKVKFPKTNTVQEVTEMSLAELNEILIDFALKHKFYIVCGNLRATKAGIKISRIEGRTSTLFLGKTTTESTLKAIRWLIEHNFNKDIIDE